MFTTDFEVPFHDVDSFGVMWHGHYFKYFEITLTKLLRESGLDAQEMATLGLRLVIAESRVRFMRPLRFGDAFQVQAQITETELRLGATYDVYRMEDMKRCCRARVVMVFIDAEGKLVYRVPEPVRRCLQRYCAS